MRNLLRLAIATICLLVGPQVAPVSATPDPPALYDYVYAGQYGIQTDGAYALMEGARPKLAPSGSHTLVEMSVQSSDGRQIIEVGWTVDPAVNGDSQPRLFVFHWVDGQPTCYNTCGFVPLSDAPQPESTVVPLGVDKGYAIMHYGNVWWVWYDTSWIGYFPDSLWSGRYTKAGLIQVFGEVANQVGPTCTQMGNGKFGDQAGASDINSFRLLGSSSVSRLSYSGATNPNRYRIGNVTGTSFTFGGPGAC